MKKYFINMIIAVSITAIGCNNAKEKTAEELLNTPEMENKIDSAILGNNAHLSKFMNMMMANENCKKMMVTSDPMVKMMCLSGNMDSLMKTDKEMIESTTNRMINFMKADTAVCDKTCTRILEDEYLKEKILEKAKTNEGTKSK